MVYVMDVIFSNLGYSALAAFICALIIFCFMNMWDSWCDSNDSCEVGEKVYSARSSGPGPFIYKPYTGDLPIDIAMSEMERYHRR